jgi:hypothetical protein
MFAPNSGYLSKKVFVYVSRKSWLISTSSTNICECLQDIKDVED